MRGNDVVIIFFRFSTLFCFFFFLYFIPLIAYRERRRISVESCCGRCRGFLFESMDVDKLIEGYEYIVI